MSLARTNNPLSQVIIRQIGDVGGPRADSVNAELDSLIAWARLSPRCIHRNVTATGNVGAGLDNLHSFSLPANSLETNLDWVRAGYGGTFATNDNDKRIQVTFDGQTAFNSGLRDLDTGVWRVCVDYIRVSSTSVRASGFAMLGIILAGTDGVLDTGNSRYYMTAINATLTVANLNSNAVTMLVQAEATANDDVQQNASIIELCQQ